MRWTGRVIGVLLALALAALVVAGSATARNVGVEGAPVAVNLKFRPVVRSVGIAGCGNTVLVSGNYALVPLPTPTFLGCPNRFLLFDAATGTRTIIRKAGLTHAWAFAAHGSCFNPTATSRSTTSRARAREPRFACNVVPTGRRPMR
jgi:hypothetical protein